MERKFGRKSGPNLMLILVICYAAGYVINRIFPAFSFYIAFYPDWILKGQVWRIISFVFMPSTSSIFLAFITCFIYISISKALEQVIGRFRVNFFLITGLILEILIGFLYSVVFSGSAYLTYVMYFNPYYLYAMLFVLFAMMYPDARFLLMFVIPIKGKWMVLVTFVMYALDVISAFSQGNPGYGWALVFMIVAAVLNVVLFILVSNYRAISNKNVVRMRKYRKKAESAEQQRMKNGFRHKCAVCGRTDATNPELDFRYCSRCSGNYEYCSEHLYTHIHVGTDNKE